MHWQSRVLHDFRLYAVTDITDRSKSSILKKIEAVYRGGADIVQLRAKNLAVNEKLRLGRAMAQLAKKFKKLYFVNDSLSLALLTGAHGVHVGQDDLPPKEIRKLCARNQKNLFVGLSTHSRQQVRAAQREPIDYFAVGPVFKTPTKPDYGSVGLKLIRYAQKQARKPWVAIGGINEANLDFVRQAGAARVAVVRAVFGAANSELASRRLVQKIRGDKYA